MIKNSEQSFNIFYAHSSDLQVTPHSFWQMHFQLLTIEGIENLVSYLQISCLQTGVVPLRLKVSLSEINYALHLQDVHESPKIEHLSFSDKRNQTLLIKRKRKS